MSKAFLGIDVSKKELVVALLLKNASILKKKFTNDIKGFRQLVKWLKEKRVEEVKVCMEATGNYSSNVADFLYERHYEVHVINPLCIKSFAKSKLSRTKTDEADAEIIAEYASKIDSIPYKPRSPQLKEIRELYRCLESLKKQYTETTNHLEHENLLPKSVVSVWKKLKKHLEKEINEVETSLEALCHKDTLLVQQYKNLQTIPGIGKTTAIAIIAETPDLSEFKSARQLAAYSGLVPRHRTSGSSIRGKARLSKLGSSKLRKALYFPAIVAKNHNPVFKEFCKKMKKKGKHSMVIIGAIMRKLIHIIFGILKNNVAFNPHLIVNG